MIIKMGVGGGDDKIIDRNDKMREMKFDLKGNEGETKGNEGFE